MISPMDTARVGGVARYARKHGWHLMIQDRLGYTPLAWNGDGIIATLRRDAAVYDGIRTFMKRGIPVVDLTMERPNVAVPRVTSDHAGIGRLAAEHFAERNFRNVVWFSIGWSHVHELRYKGLCEESPAGKWVLPDELPKRRQNDWNAFSKWLCGKLSAANRPLAALTYDEADAVRLLDAAERIGMSVPEELAILSIGNNPIICENQSVTLSSIDQNLELGGYEAAALLDRLMEGENSPKRPVLVPPAGIVLRQSTDTIAVSDPVLRQALGYIATNLSGDFGAEQIADSLGVKRNALDKRFAHGLGRSVGHEIMRQRLAKAKLLLRNTTQTIAQISVATGFCTPSHLSNTFRAAMGMTPRAWRQQERRNRL